MSEIKINPTVYKVLKIVVVLFVIFSLGCSFFLLIAELFLSRIEVGALPVILVVCNICFDFWIIYKKFPELLGFDIASPRYNVSLLIKVFALTCASFVIKFISFLVCLLFGSCPRNNKLRYLVSSQQCPILKQSVRLMFKFFNIIFVLSNGIDAVDCLAFVDYFQPVFLSYLVDRE